MERIRAFFTKYFEDLIGLKAYLFRYCIAGGIAAIIDIGSFYFFVTYLSIYYPLSIFISFSLGTFVNFLICNFFIFDRGHISFERTFLRHYLSSLGGLATNELVMFSLIDIIHFQGMLVAKIISTVSAFFVNFLLIKFYVFNSKVSLRKMIREIK